MYIQPAAASLTQIFKACLLTKWSFESSGFFLINLSLYLHIMIKHIRPLWNQGGKSGVYWSGLHDSHDLIEENPVGQPRVAGSGTLWHRVHLHVLAVERNAVLPLHHLLKQLNLWQQKQSCFFY